MASTFYLVQIPLKSLQFILVKIYSFSFFLQFFKFSNFSTFKLYYFWGGLQFVDENYRGKGFSVLLINESKKFCKQTEACGLILETAKTNEIGNNLYPKTGFTLDREHNYYSWDNN